MAAFADDGFKVAQIMKIVFVVVGKKNIVRKGQEVLVTSLISLLPQCPGKHSSSFVFNLVPSTSLHSNFFFLFKLDAFVDDSFIIAQIVEFIFVVLGKLREKKELATGFITPLPTMPWVSNLVPLFAIFSLKSSPYSKFFLSKLKAFAGHFHSISNYGFFVVVRKKRQSGKRKNAFNQLFFPFPHNSIIRLISLGCTKFLLYDEGLREFTPKNMTLQHMTGASI